jgi:uncharacterized membrane protein (UPF0127 family)
MKSQAFVLQRYDADEGMVFDYKEPRYNTVMEGEEEKQEQTHLYAKTLFIGVGDSIDNYVEVKAPTV